MNRSNRHSLHVFSLNSLELLHVFIKNLVLQYYWS